MDARAPHVAALIEADRYGPSELIAAASTAQELRCPCFVVLLRVFRRTRSAQSSAELVNRQLAEALGAIVVECVAPNPVDAAIAFVRDEQITHVVVGRGRPSEPISVDSIEQRLASSVRGVGVQVVALPSDEPVSIWRAWTSRGATLHVTLLFAVLALATAAIVYVSWPLVFALVVVAAGIWCWQLDVTERAAAEVVAGDATIPRRADSERRHA